MTHFTKLFHLSLVKSIVIASALFTASFAGADDSQALQLAQTSDGFNAEEKYMASCFACHSTGAAGAPKVEPGVYDAEWAERMEKGMEAVMQNVINGINAMPARGLCFDCNDADLQALVDYMISSRDRKSVV